MLFKYEQYSSKTHAQPFKMRPIPAFYDLPIAHNSICIFGPAELDIEGGKGLKNKI